MKTYPKLLLGIVAGLAAISAVLAADPAPKKDSRIEVVFTQPEKFTDVRDSYTGSEMGRKAILDQIRDYLVREAKHYVPEGQKLTIDFTDIDLAGDFEPWRGSQGMDIRIVKDIYPPKMDFDFKLTAADGTVIKEGKRQLRDLMFMSKLSINRTDPLRYEKAMLDDWMRGDFPRAKSG
ncbi:MAG: DUF3016 domain-containing protein [Opitutaceae bacterium]